MHLLWTGLSSLLNSYQELPVVWLIIIDLDHIPIVVVEFNRVLAG